MDNTASCFTQHPSKEACTDAGKSSDPKTLPNDFGVYPVASKIIAVAATGAALAAICDALLTSCSAQYANYFSKASNVSIKRGNKEPLLEYASSSDARVAPVTRARNVAEDDLSLAKSASAPDWMRRSLPLFLLCSALLTASSGSDGPEKNRKTGIIGNNNRFS